MQSLTGFGYDTAEVGLDVADMDGNGKGDLVLSWVDSASGEDVPHRITCIALPSKTSAIAGLPGTGGKGVTAVDVEGASCPGGVAQPTKTTAESSPAIRFMPRLRFDTEA